MDSSLRNQLPKSLPISIISTIRRLSFINERSETMLDNTDYQILNELTQNSRMTMKELDQKVHLTGQATSTRVAKLEDSGVIEGYTIKVNDTKLGYNIHAIINIYTKSLQHDAYLNFINVDHQYVFHNYKIGGDGYYLIDAKFPSNQELDEFLTALNKHVNYKLNFILNDTKKIRSTLLS